ncbi:acyl-CoA carboxylase epsilon subunit, partial [Kitasatospora sp. NPDC056138]|uniref:acyl-CoA carboxylase epsilon subunit n=1 Tax=Kitasatospora sp. NPDC056138 TaxID=3345724 RepID=UPI0035E08361
RGSLTDEELAALTAVLLARAAAARAAAQTAVVRLHGWRPADYTSPVSWRRAA